jgi:hypothetical protein
MLQYPLANLPMQYWFETPMSSPKMPCIIIPISA